MMVFCDEARCEKEAIFHVVCDGVDTIVCQSHMGTHYEHFNNTFSSTRILPIPEPEGEWE